MVEVGQKCGCFFKAEEQAQKAVEIARMAEGGPEYEKMEDKAPKRVRAGN